MKKLFLLAGLLMAPASLALAALVPHLIFLLGVFLAGPLLATSPAGVFTPLVFILMIPLAVFAIEGFLGGNAATNDPLNWVL